MVRGRKPSSGSPRRRPRTRGDGPPPPLGGGGSQRSAPHARGWSRRLPGAAHARGVGPARAGMVLLSSPPEEEGDRRPRTRGDGPFIATVIRGVLVSAPHARGWSPDVLITGPAYKVGPARAGMVPPSSSARSAAACRPRTRGDGPLSAPTVTHALVSAPHARGWSSASVRICRLMVVGPARAGMVPHFPTGTRAAVGRPRTRGDGPRRIRIFCGILSSAPHARGWSWRGMTLTALAEVGPARAGMVRRNVGRHAECRGRPRTRGDDPSSSRRVSIATMSAPHARG